MSHTWGWWPLHQSLQSLSGCGYESRWCFSWRAWADLYACSSGRDDITPHNSITSSSKQRNESLRQSALNLLTGKNVGCGAGWCTSTFHPSVTVSSYLFRSAALQMRLIMGPAFPFGHLKMYNFLLFCIYFLYLSSPVRNFKTKDLSHWLASSEKI